MAGFSIILIMFLLLIVGVISLIGIIFLITSLILFARKKKTGKKFGAITTLVISIILLLPLAGLIVFGTIASVRSDMKKQEEINNLDNKVYTYGEYWKDGFKYNGEDLIPVDLLLYTKNYRTRKLLENKYGALVNKNDKSYKNIYKFKSDSGIDLYYVYVSSFAGGINYPRVFVEKNKYNELIDYYKKSNLNVRAYFYTSPNGYDKEKVEYTLEEYQNELFKLAIEVLADVSKRREVMPIEKDVDSKVDLLFESDDYIFALHIIIVKKDGETILYLDDYKIEDEITRKYDNLIHYLNVTAENEINQIYMP